MAVMSSQGGTSTAPKDKFEDIYRRRDASSNYKNAAMAVGALGTVGALRRGRSLKETHDFNAGLLANNAKSVLADARTENLRTQKATEGLIADQTGAIAKSGVQMSGSPMELLADTASEGNLAQQFNSYYANLSAENFKSESNLSKRAGRDARKASYLEAGGSLLAGALPMLY
jgi:hypothetical protein